LSGLNSFKFAAKDLLTDNNSSINTDIMNFLSIDFSTEVGSLFVKLENKTFSKNLQSHKFNNDLLMKEILIFFNKNDIKFDNISMIFANQGPGNFSGLRASLATAKGVSLSRDIKLFGYNTFIWSCVNFFKKENTIFSIIRFREKYFIQQFDKNLKIISNAKEIKEERLINEYENEFKVIPKNVAKNFNKKILELKNLKVVELDHNKLELLKLNGLLDEDFIKPLYLS